MLAKYGRHMTITSPWLRHLNLNFTQLRLVHGNVPVQSLNYYRNYQQPIDYNLNKQKNSIVHQLTHYAKLDPRQAPQAGSLVEFVSRNNESSDSSDSLDVGLGLVVKNQEYYLTNKNRLDVLHLDGRILQVNPDDVTFTHLNFINLETFEARSSRIDLCAVMKNHISGTMRVLKYLVERDFIVEAYYNFAQKYKESSIAFPDIINHFLSTDTTLLDYLQKSDLLECLHLAVHIIIMNDPIHFRFYKVENNPMTAMNPLEQITSNYYINPLTTTFCLESLHSVPNLTLLTKYQRYLIDSTVTGFEIDKLSREDDGFRTLIKYIRYTINYPHPILTTKLQSLLNFKASSNSLFDLLLKLDIYSKDTNHILSTELYGLSAKDELSITDRRSITFPVTKQQSEENLELKLQIDENTAQPRTTRKFAGYSLPFQISERLAFSYTQNGIGSYIFNFFVPIPNDKVFKLNLTNPISDMLDGDWPTIPKFKRHKYDGQRCLKASFNLQYFNPDSLINPTVEISLDKVNNFVKVDKKFFAPPSLSTVWGKDEFEMKVLKSFGRLYNLLKLKEHARLSYGYLKLDPNEPEDHDWFMRNSKMLVNELLASYGHQNGLELIYKYRKFNPVESKDYREFTTFKFLKWKVNSYLTFRDSTKSSTSDDYFTAYFSCLRYLENPKITTSFKKDYGPLGLKAFANFTDYGYLDSYINTLQLVEYIIKNKSHWYMKKILPVLESNTNSYLLLKQRLRKNETLKVLKARQDEFHWLNCIILSPPDVNSNSSSYNPTVWESVARCYCFQLDMNLDVIVDKRIVNVDELLVGDKLIVNHVVRCDPLNEVLVMK